ncbi:MAG: hypothetical protein O8C61_09250 [Candidatus Methanoperedens sp.]|nr:hypothetical protein [Candidatus Methanoperedens sp.]
MKRIMDTMVFLGAIAAILLVVQQVSAQIKVTYPGTQNQRAGII